MNTLGESENRGGRSAARWLGAALLALLLLALFVWVLNALVVEPALEERLARAVREASQQNLSIDREALEVDMDLLGGAVELRNLRLHPDSAAIGRRDSLEGAGEGTARITNPASSASLKNLWLNCERVRVSGFGPADLFGAGRDGVSGLLEDREIELQCRSFRWEPDTQPYRYTAAAFRYETSAGVFRADTLRLIPRFPKYEFSRLIGHEIDRIDLTIPLLELRDIDQQALTAGRELRAGGMLIENMVLEVFHDKRMPAGQPEYKPLPQERLRHFPYPFSLDTLMVRNADVTYAEHKNLVDDPGVVRFRSVDGDFSRISSIEPQNLVMTVRSRFLGAADLTVKARFMMDDSLGRHTITGTMGPLEMSAMNPQMRNLAFVQATRGTLHGMRYSLQLDRESSSGEVVLDYENLNIEVLHREAPAEAGGRALQSFLVNAFMIRENNHEEPLRRGTVRFERVEEKSIFNYWWKSLLSGLTDSVGI